MKHSEFRLRPKNNFVNVANWEGLHSLSLHWKSDMEFYRDELRFLRKLIDKYFIWLMTESSIKETESLLDKIRKAQDQAQHILSSIGEHVKHIESEIRNPLVHNDKPFRDEHVELEDLIASFLKDFRKLKKAVFHLTENVLEEEKLKHLMAHGED